MSLSGLAAASNVINFDSALKPTRKTQPLTPEQNQLMEENYHLVRFAARKMFKQLPNSTTIEYDDLYSAGIIGLADAAQRFSPQHNTQFNTYARFRIQGAIIDSLREYDWAPRELRANQKRIDRVTLELLMILGRTPSDAEIADELGMTLQSYQRITGEIAGLDVRDLNATIGEDGEELLASIAANPKHDQLSQCEWNESQRLITSAVSNLPERERLIITMYYFEEMTHAEIGLVLGVGNSRISQLRSRAEEMLRSELKGYAPSRRKQPQKELRVSTLNMQAVA